MSQTRNDAAFETVTFPHGPAMPNRLMLAPLTNQQSHADGTLSDDEHRWLTMRALGGFGLTMTCAASVQAMGVGFAGQLGVHDDAHVAGLTRLPKAPHALVANVLLLPSTPVAVRGKIWRNGAKGEPASTVSNCTVRTAICCASFFPRN